MEPMTEIECKNETVTREQAPGLTVGDAMVSSPKVLAGDSTVVDLRTLFENPHVRTAVLVDGTEFVGVVHRDAVPASGSDDVSAAEIAKRDVITIGPAAPLTEALRIMDEQESRRLPVVADDGRTLAGLLCLTKDGQGFCQS